MLTRRFVDMIPSTIAAVPSGDPSSTTRISSRRSCDRTVSMTLAMFSRSLYVGTITSARSAAAVASGMDGPAAALGGPWSADDVDGTTQFRDRGKAAGGAEEYFQRESGNWKRRRGDVTARD